MTAWTVERMRALVEEKAEQHPELRRPLEWDGLKRILARESIGLGIVPMPRPAQLVPYLGSWTILVNASLSKRANLAGGAHELGHLWLHHDPLFDRWETTVYNASTTWEEDALEDEAETFATLLVMGPCCGTCDD